ncbi:DUF3310 domain-containing protein [Hutsoniella sourekii]|uniref:DUF3310 domain-containing protein n=1 Tax=Hutsoniella sourekii TaxID=87650 RepID=UPI00047F0F80|nr:DUF3310 domain-containing protein [Hutsoniella sourekii]
MLNKIKPEHYQQGSVDLIAVMAKVFPEGWFRGFMVGNIWKYTLRYVQKNGLEDLSKAEEYLRRLKEFENKGEK